MNTPTKDSTNTPRSRLKDKDAVLKRINKLHQHLADLDAMYRVLVEKKNKAIKDGDGAEIENTNILIQLNSQNTSRVKRKLTKLSDKLATIQTPVLVACEGEDGSIPRK